MSEQRGYNIFLTTPRAPRPERHRAMTEAGLDAYHDQVCAEATLPPERTAVMANRSTV